MDDNRRTIIGNGEEGGRASELFERAHQNAVVSEQKNLAAMRAYLATHEFRPSTIPFLPYLVVRSQTADHGQRPPLSPLAITSSPDIWVVAGVPSTTPAIPPGPGTGLDSLSPLTGQQATVYAHVWNLGRAPGAGVKVDWFWIQTPQCGAVLDGAQVHPIGFDMVDLGPRTSMDCHRLVKCPTPFTVPTGSVTVLAQVSILGDPLLEPWRPELDRHVARRDFDAATEELLDQVFDPRSVDPNAHPPSAASLCATVDRPIQTFTAGVTGELTRVEVFLGDSVGKNINVHLYQTAAGAPSGPPIASGLIPSGQVPGSIPAFVGVSMSASVTSGTRYGIGLNTEPPPLVCWTAETWKGSGSNPYADGAVYIDGTLDANTDLGFRTFVCRPAPGHAPEGQLREGSRIHPTRQGSHQRP